MKTSVNDHFSSVMILCTNNKKNKIHLKWSSINMAFFIIMVSVINNSFYVNNLKIEKLNIVYNTNEKHLKKTSWINKVDSKKETNNKSNRKNQIDEKFSNLKQSTKLNSNNKILNEASEESNKRIVNGVEVDLETFNKSIDEAVKSEINNNNTKLANSTINENPLSLDNNFKSYDKFSETSLNKAFSLEVPVIDKSKVFKNNSEQVNDIKNETMSEISTSNNNNDTKSLSNLFYNEIKKDKQIEIDSNNKNTMSYSSNKISDEDERLNYDNVSKVDKNKQLIENCKVFSKDEENCLLCRNGFYLYKSTCVIDCPDNHIKNNLKGVCDNKIEKIFEKNKFSCKNNCNNEFPNCSCKKNCNLKSTCCADYSDFCSKSDFLLSKNNFANNKIEESIYNATIESIKAVTDTSQNKPLEAVNNNDNLNDLTSNQVNLLYEPLNKKIVSKKQKYKKGNLKIINENSNNNKVKYISEEKSNNTFSNSAVNLGNEKAYKNKKIKHSIKKNNNIDLPNQSFNSLSTNAIEAQIENQLNKNIQDNIYQNNLNNESNENYNSKLSNDLKDNANDKFFYDKNNFNQDDKILSYDVKEVDIPKTILEKNLYAKDVLKLKNLNYNPSTQHDLKGELDYSNDNSNENNSNKNKNITYYQDYLINKVGTEIFK